MFKHILLKKIPTRNRLLKLKDLLPLILMNESHWMECLMNEQFKNYIEPFTYQYKTKIYYDGIGIYLLYRYNPNYFFYTEHKPYFRILDFRHYRLDANEKDYLTAKVKAVCKIPLTDDEFKFYEIERKKRGEPSFHDKRKYRP